MTGFEIFAVIMMVVAAVGGAATAIQSGKAQKKSSRNQAEYSRQQAESTALQAKREAEWAEYRIDINEQQAEVKKRTAKQTALETMKRAGMKKGISSDSGSLLDEEIRGINELGYTLDLIDWETAIGSTNIKKEQGTYNYQAALAEKQGEWATSLGDFQAEQATTGSYYQAGSSLLAGGAQIAGSYNARNSTQKVQIVQ